MVDCPSILENSVLTSALPVMVSEKLPCCGSANVVVTWTLVASGRVNRVLKSSSAFCARLPAVMDWASLDSIRALASSADCMAVRADAARLKSTAAPTKPKRQRSERKHRRGAAAGIRDERLKQSLTVHRPLCGSLRLKL